MWRTIDNGTHVIWTIKSFKHNLILRSQFIRDYSSPLHCDERYLVKAARDRAIEVLYDMNATKYPYELRYSKEPHHKGIEFQVPYTPKEA